MDQEQEKDFARDGLRVRLEIIPQDMAAEDVVLTDELRQDALLALPATAQVVETGEEKVRGGISPVDILMAMQGLTTFVWAHKDTIERAMNDSAALVTICGGVAPVIKSLFVSHEKHADPESGPLKVTLKFRQDALASITVEAKDVEGTEAGLKLAEKVRQQYPTVAPQIGPNSGVSVVAEVPKQARRGRKRH